jgi:hypothetical protein
MRRRYGKLLENVFCEFAKKIKDGEEGWKNVGVALMVQRSRLFKFYQDIRNVTVLERRLQPSPIEFG